MNYQNKHCEEISLKRIISNITSAIIEKQKNGNLLPLEAIYSICNCIKIIVDRVVKNIAAYIILGITLEGKKREY